MTIAPGKRAAVALPWASSREAALERASVVQGLVDRLREAGHTDLVPKVIESAAAEDLARFVRGLHPETLLAGEKLAASLDYTATLQTVARLTVPALADLSR